MIRFNIPGMTCGGCARSITAAILGVDAQAEVEVDIPAKSIGIDTRAAPDALVAAIREAGYEARLM